METKQLLDTYYKGLAQRKDWDAVLTDDFQFIGGDMTRTTPVKSKASYIEVIQRFSKVFKNMRVKDMIIEGDKASVIANYDFVFPNGKSMSGNVAEIWEVKNGKLHSLTIYFDTLTFNINSNKQ
jgi:ketosteroid isomerase-like protein